MSEYRLEPSPFAVRVDGNPLSTWRCREANMALHSAAGPLDIEVDVPFDWERVTVRPLRHGIVSERTATGIRFALPAPAKLSIEFDDDLKNPLLLLINPPEDARPDIDDPSVHYFKAGIEHDAGEIRLATGETLYLEEGAIVHGHVTLEKAHGARIMGRGILHGCRFDHLGKGKRPQMIKIIESDGVVVEGITVVNGPNWHIVPIACRNTRIRNVNLVTFTGTGDGVDVTGSEETSITGCFIRSNDDCIAIKAVHYMHPAGCKNVSGVHVSDCVFWNAAYGNALEIGYETQCETIANVVFENSDIIHAEFEGWTSGGTFTIHNGDRALVHNVTYRDIRVEDSREKLIDLKIQQSRYSRDTERGKINNIRFENIAIVDGPFPVSIIQGYDIDHLVSNIAIANLTYHGERITNANAARMVIEMAPNVVFE